MDLIEKIKSCFYFTTKISGNELYCCNKKDIEELIGKVEISQNFLLDWIELKCPYCKETVLFGDLHFSYDMLNKKLLAKCNKCKKDSETNIKIIPNELEKESLDENNIMKKKLDENNIMKKKHILIGDIYFLICEFYAIHFSKECKYNCSFDIEEIDEGEFCSLEIEFPEMKEGMEFISQNFLVYLSEIKNTNIPELLEKINEGEKFE